MRNSFKEWSRHDGNGPEICASAHPVRAQARMPSDILGPAAADHVLRTGEVAYCLCRPPEHHATCNLAGGFCYINNSALAAQMAVSEGRWVAILDIDVHHGNGTQAIFHDREDVLTVSLHGPPEDLYPFYTDETGGCWRQKEPQPAACIDVRN